MKIAWLVVLLLLVACSGQSATSVSSPTVASPTPAPSTSSASCRLAVISGAPGQGSGPQTPGFLTIPGLSFTPAADAAGGMFYDRPLKRWLLWSPPAVSEDGLTYAYIDGDKTSSRLHLVDLKTNKDRVLAEGGPWRLVGLLPDAVYVMSIEYLPDSPAFGVMVKGRGLWKVPLEGGAAVQLTNDTRGWVYVSTGAAWASSGTLDVAGGPSDVFRLDLQTREVTTWFARGTRSRLLAVDASGVPLIMNETDLNELWRVPSPSAGVKVWSAAPKAMGPYAPVAVDGSVVWFSSRSTAREWGIYRYSAEKGVESMASFTDRPVSVAGPCA